MQPSWREGESLLRTPPEHADIADWNTISYAGSNGFALVVTALSWWIVSTNDDEKHSEELSTAIDDVQWVLSGVVKAFGAPSSETGTSLGKRSHASESDTQEELSSKK